MSHLTIFRIFLIFSLLIFISSCGDKEILEENTGALSQEVNMPELSQETVNRLKLLENQNTINTETSVISEQTITTEEIAINTQETIAESNNSIGDTTPVGSSAINSEKPIVTSTTQTQVNQNTSNQTIPNLSENIIESAPVLDIPEPIITTTSTISTQEIVTPSQEIVTPSPVEKNIIQKVVDVVVSATKSIVQTVKNIVTPKAKTEGIISSSPTLPSSPSNPITPTPVVPFPLPTIGSGNTTQSNATGSTINPVSNTQSGTTQTTQTQSGGTSTNGSNSGTNIPNITNIAVPPTGVGAPDIAVIDDSLPETIADMIIEEVDENAGIAQFAQGNFSGLDKSNPLNLTTENGLPIILYQFSLNQTLTSPTVIVGKVQKSFVFDGLFGVQIFNANDEKIKDWYATTFFSQDSGDEANGMVYFLIELVYDENFSNKTPTGYVRFLVDNPTSNTSKDDFIDISVSFPL